MNRICLRLIVLWFCIFAAHSAWAVTLSVTSVNPTCANCNGSLTLSASNGTPAYQYSINGGITWSTSTNYTNRCAGTYTCIVKDALNNRDTVIVTLTSPPPLVFTASGVNATTMSSCDGQILINISGGTPPYNVTITGPSGNIPFISSPVTGLCVGTYTITVTDSSACPAHYGTGSGSTGGATISIGAGGGTTSPLFISASGSMAQCNNPCNYLYATASGGIPPYQYSFGSGWTTSSSSPCLNGAPFPQTFTVCVKDAMNSVVCTTVTVGWPLYNPLVNFSWVHPHCGACDGSITIITNFGPGTVYAISPSYASSSSPTFSNLCPGTYSVSIVPPASSGYCPVMISATLVNQNGVLGVSSSVTNATCNGNCNGSVTITATGAGPFEYSINGGVTWQSSNTFNALCAGTYTVQVRNLSHTCTGSTTFTVTQPPAFTTTTTINTPSCNGMCNGSITASTSPSGAYQYSINGGVTWQSSGTFSGLCAGTYTILTKNSNGCTITQNITVTQPAALSQTSQTINNPSCTAASNGSISIVVSGGTPSYSYNWTPGNPTGDGTPNVSNLTAGSWSCTITDSRGCTLTRTFTLTAPAPPVLTVNSFTNVNCYGGNTGTASVTATGGNGNYSYNWTPGNPPGDGTNSVSGLSAGTWTCTVTDGAAACSSTVSITITQPSALAVSVTNAQHISCYGGQNGSASVSASGGTGSYTYAWLPSGGNNATATNLSAGTYSCTITDGAGCSNTQTVTITEPPVLNVSLSSFTNISCYGNANGTATVLASGGNGNYSYDWTPGNPAGDGTQTASGLNTGSYTCTVTDPNGCTASASVTITEPPLLQIDSTQSTAASCYGNSNGSATVFVSGGTGNYSYDWMPGNPAGDGTPTASGLNAATYNCTITDLNGCSATASVIITEPPLLQVDSVRSTAASCYGNSNGSATVFVSGGNGSYNYNWLPSGGNTATASNLATGTYSCTITDSQGCTVSTSTTLTQPAEIQATANIVSPNCYGICTGHIDIAVIPQNNYSYSFDLGNSWQPNNSLTGLCDGVFTAIVKDSAGCTDTIFSLVMQQPDQLIGTVTVNQTSCGLCNGSVVASATGGNPGYNYVYLNNTMPMQPNQICPGNYICITTDANGCQDTIQFTVYPSLNLQIDSVTVIGTPSSLSNGSATVYAQGNGFISFLWDSAAGYQTGSTATNLNAGYYCVTATDSTGCTDSACVFVPVITDTKTFFAGAELQIYPNPFSDQLMINGEGTWYIYLENTIGEIVADFGLIQISNAAVLDIPGETANGLYILKAVSGHTVYSARLIRQR